MRRSFVAMGEIAPPPDHLSERIGSRTAVQDQRVAVADEGGGVLGDGALLLEPLVLFHLIGHVDRVPIGDRHGAAVSSLDEPGVSQRFEISTNRGDIDAKAEGELP